MAAGAVCSAMIRNKQWRIAAHRKVDEGDASIPSECYDLDQ